MLVDTAQFRSWLAAEHRRAVEAAECMQDPAMAEFEKERLDDTAAEREHLVAAIEALANAACITKYCTEVSRGVPQHSQASCP